MLRTMKKSFSIVLVLAIMLSSFAMFASAETVEEETVIMPRFSTIHSVSTSFTISGLNSTSYVALISQYSTSLYIKIELQKEKSTGYETIETWTKSGTGTMLSLEKTRLINILSDYRIKVTCTAGNETHVTYDYP